MQSNSSYCCSKGALAWVPRKLWHPQIFRGMHLAPMKFRISAFAPASLTDWHPLNSLSHYQWHPRFQILKAPSAVHNQSKWIWLINHVIENIDEFPILKGSTSNTQRQCRNRDYVSSKYPLYALVQCLNNDAFIVMMPTLVWWQLRTFFIVSGEIL